MNHLAHFLLCPPDDQMRAGTLIADHVRGTDLSMFAPRVEQGIRLHRRVDALVDNSPEVIALKPLVGAPLRRYAGILLDVFFDYALLRQWNEHIDQSVDIFNDAVYASLRLTDNLMPPQTRAMARRMCEFDTLRSCETMDGCAHTLRRIASRLKHPVPLDDGLAFLREHEAGISAACRTLIPALKRHTEADI